MEPSAWEGTSGEAQEPPQERGVSSQAGPGGLGCSPAGSLPIRASQGLMQMRRGFASLPGRGWDWCLAQTVDFL